MHKFNLLTRKEREVLYFAKTGFSNKEIAQKLFVSVNTIKTHRKNLMLKLELSGKIEMNKFLLSDHSLYKCI
jgi:DNA-binding NarL/FixJ family response regulator